MALSGADAVVDDDPVAFADACRAARRGTQQEPQAKAHPAAWIAQEPESLLGSFMPAQRLKTIMKMLICCQSIPPIVWAN